MRLGSSGFHQEPPSLRSLPTITASATESTSRTLAAVAPLPARTGSRHDLRAAERSEIGVATPVELPVTITPSAPKNSAACAWSASEVSWVIACAVCFFLMSQKTATFSAPSALR